MEDSKLKGRSQKDSDPDFQHKLFSSLGGDMYQVLGHVSLAYNHSFMFQMEMRLHETFNNLWCGCSWVYCSQWLQEPIVQGHDMNVLFSASINSFCYGVYLKDLEKSLMDLGS